MWVFVCFLAGCTAPGPGSEFHRHTGVTVHRSVQTLRFVDTISRVEASAVIMERGGQRIWAIKTFVTRNDLNFPEIQTVWAQGRKVPYVLDDRRRFGRQRQETGHIPLDADFFEQAATSGFTFEMVGLRGRYEIHIPAHTFGQAIRLYKNGKSQQ